MERIEVPSHGPRLAASLQLPSRENAHRPQKGRSRHTTTAPPPRHDFRSLPPPPGGMGKKEKNPAVYLGGAFRPAHTDTHTTPSQFTQRQCQCPAAWMTCRRDSGTRPARGILRSARRRDEYSHPIAQDPHGERWIPSALRYEKERRKKKKKREVAVRGCRPSQCVMTGGARPPPPMPPRKRMDGTERVGAGAEGSTLRRWGVWAYIHMQYLSR